MKFKTESGTTYLHQGIFLTRLSEKPVFNCRTEQYDTEPIVNKVIERTYPVGPVIGEGMIYYFSDGTNLRTSRVTEIELDHHAL